MLKRVIAMLKAWDFFGEDDGECFIDRHNANIDYGVSFYILST